MERPPLEEIPVITKEQIEGTHRLLRRIDLSKKSPLEGVKNAECLSCGTPSASYADDIVFEYYAPGERIVITNLSGLRCSKCGDVAYDLKSCGIIERQLERLPMTGYEVSISKLGAGKLGIYFTKDLMRVMDLKPGGKAIVTPITRHKMVVEV
jgi:YgiT-type zinc finger domain-containing protein